MKKPRSDAKLLNLGAEEQRSLFEALRDGMSYVAAVLYCKKEYGIETSVGALHHFWTEMSGKEQEARWLKAVTSAEDIRREAAENLPLVDEATVAALSQAAFEAALRNDAKATKTFMTLVLKSKSQSVDERKVAIMEARAAQADEAEKIAKENVTDKEKAARLSALFGM